MKLTIVHETLYRFGEPANHSIQYLRQTPRQAPCQRVVSWTLSTRGQLTPWTDGFDNTVHVVTTDEPHDEIKVVVEGVVETVDTVGVLPAKDGLPPLIFLRETRFTAAGDGVRGLAEPFRAQAAEEGTLAALHAMMAAIAGQVTYQPGITTVESDAEHAVAEGAGVCQDHAHIFIAAARVLGVPARYVSGYILAGSGNDSHLASHAWAEAFVEGLGWVSFDPSNQQSATDAYVRLAIGFDYESAAPVRGHRVGGGFEEMSVHVQVSQAQ
ncbi:MAG: transglutaminase domain-containing protein [Rhodospirillales bacterium]